MASFALGNRHLFNCFTFHLLLISLFVVSLVSRQSFAASSISIDKQSQQPSKSQLRFSPLGKNLSLTQNTVNDILQDNEGIIWIATFGGLHKYDGMSLELITLERERTKSVTNVDKSQVISRLFEDRQGRLWVGSNHGTVFIIDKVSGTITDLTSKLNPLAFQSKLAANVKSTTFGGLIHLFFEDSNGRMWIGSNKGLVIYDTRLGEVVDATQLIAQAINWAGLNDVHHAHQDHLWIGSGKGLHLIDFTNLTLVKSYIHNPDDSTSISSNIVSAIHVQGDDVWLGTYGGGVNRLHLPSGIFEQFLSDPFDPHSIGANNITDITRDSAGQLWIGTLAGGLNRFEPQQNHFTRFTKHKNNRFGLPNNTVTSIFEDRSKVLWVGTAGSGIVKLVPSTRKFSVIESVPFDQNSLSDGFVWQFSYGHNQLLWIATHDGLNSYDANTGDIEVYRYNPSVSGEMRNNQILTMDNRTEGLLWVGTRDGRLFEFDTVSYSFTPIGQPAFNGAFSRGRMWNIHRDSANYMWISTPEGTYRLSPEEQLQLIQGKVDFKPMLNQIVRMVYEDEMGRFWLGTHFQGIMVLAADMMLMNHISNDPLKIKSLSHNTVRSIAQDNVGNMWVGTHSGLNKMIRPQSGIIRNKFQHFFVADGLPNNTIYSILNEDEHLWLATNHGLSKINPQDGQVQNYDINDGLPGNEFNGGAAIRAVDGTLYFGGVNGIAYFKSAELVTNDIPPPVVISKLLVNGQAQGNQFSIKHLDDISLSYEENNLTFNFSALDFHQPERNRLQYRLFPYQKEWESTTSGWVKYANVAPSDYEFHVRGSNNDNVWSIQHASLALTINPPWWRHPIAYTLYICLLLMALFIYHRQEVTKKLYLERMVLARTQDLASANDELAQSIEKVEDAREAAEHANELKSTFLANMSHEIRTPLTAIIGFTEHALNPNHDKVEQKGYLQRVLRSGQHLLRLINEILDLSKIEAEKLELERKEINLFELLADIESFSLALAQDDGLQFKVLYQYPLPVIFVGDLVRVRQVLYNLCSNAVKFTRKGKVSLLVRHLPQNQQLHFSIQDTGIGMSSDELTRLFQPFVQADCSITRQFGGSGLGLVISQKLVHLMKGELTVESTKGVGSDFDVFLPINTAVPDMVEKMPQYQRPEHHKKQQIERYEDAKVLVVEDNQDNQVLITLLLKPFGVEVALVENGILAVESALLESFDLILMDIQMPVMGGGEAVALMRNAGIDCPIVALTANIMNEDIDRYLSSGFDATLAKPIQNHLFYETINRYLNQVEDQEAKSLDDLIEELKNGDEFKKLQQGFKQSIPDIVSQFEQLMQTQQWDILRDQAHSVKGSAASMGYPQLTELAGTIENLLLSGDSINVQAAVIEFNQTCEVLLAEV